MGRRTLAAVLTAVALTAVSAPVAADAATAHGYRAGSAREALAAQQRVHPGRVAGNRIYYPDGSVYVALPLTTLSLSQCDSGAFCLWSGTSFSGSVLIKTGQDVTRTIGTGPWKSMWNNRAKGARLYNEGSTASTCYAPGASVGTLGSTYWQADKVYLSDTTGC